VGCDKPLDYHLFTPSDDHRGTAMPSSLVRSAAASLAGLRYPLCAGMRAWWQFRDKRFD